jgi:hypothetical protein
LIIVRQCVMIVGDGLVGITLMPASLLRTQEMAKGMKISQLMASPISFIQPAFIQDIDIV